MPSTQTVVATYFGMTAACAAMLDGCAPTTYNGSIDAYSYYFFKKNVLLLAWLKYCANFASTKHSTNTHVEKLAAYGWLVNLCFGWLTIYFTIKFVFL